MKKILTLLGCVLLSACSGDIQVDDAVIVCNDGSTFRGTVSTTDSGYAYEVYNSNKMAPSIRSVRVTRESCMLKENS